MNFDELDGGQRAREVYHGLAVPAERWVVVRVDGRSFTALTKAAYTKPFDDRFGAAMAAVAGILLQEFDGVYGYAQSDEISIVLPPGTTRFGRGVEKLVSLTAATATAAFAEVTTPAPGRRATFDSRLWVGGDLTDVVDYFSWRQADAARNALNSCLYWALIGQGRTPRQAQQRITGLSRSAKHELLAMVGTGLDRRPAWQHRGVGLWVEAYEKTAYDPKAQTEVTAVRRKIRLEDELPEGSAYRELVREVVEAALARAKG